MIFLLNIISISTRNIWDEMWLKTALILLILTLLIIIILLGYIIFIRRNPRLKKIANKRTREIQKKNTELRRQKNELLELNQLLEKRQKRIENQALNLKKTEEEYEQLNQLLIKRQKRMEKQAESLKKSEEEMEQLNELLEKRQIRIENQALHLAQQRDELQELNETKDKLFSIIAHDLKNPFNTILGFTDLIRSNFNKYDKQKLGEINETLYQTTSQIYKLLENLLNWSRSQMGTISFNLENIDLNILTEDIKSLLDSSAKNKNIELILNIESGIIVKADKNMLHTVIRNLVTNAIKFTNNGSITIKGEKTNGSINISITDTGIGMSEEILNNLFKVNKVKSRKGTDGESGTGLGMIICKEFILKHNGTIHATSKPDYGTSMYISLPG